MSKVLFDVAAFRAQFTALLCNPPMSDVALQGYFDIATIYINNQSGGCYLGGLKTPQLRQALYLMTAHLLAINNLIAQGQAPGIMTAATVDKVSVTLEPPPAGNTWQYWLQSTPYGQQLLALLQLAGVGGFFYGGRPVLNGYRR